VIYLAETWPIADRGSFVTAKACSSESDSDDAALLAAGSNLIDYKDRRMLYKSFSE
jgi:hypothetical protein